jgi:hypothetical protein
VAAGQPLPLADGLNPAWAERIAAFRDQVVTPLLGPRDTLAQDEWATLSARFAAYRAWLSEKPATAVHDLDSARLEQLRTDGTRERLAALIAQDLAADTSAATIDALERLVRYQRDLVTLLRNFVTLSDFYGGTKKAIFQAGTLYLDQRSCDLVLRVADMGKHATLAPFSGCFLAYCTCTRTGSDPISIVAALTGGEVDELMMPGRNGIFYDRDGRDWRATVVKVVEQPVSIRQAFWSPYRRIGSFIEEQIRKFAASRDKDVESKATTGLTESAAKAGDGAAARTVRHRQVRRYLRRHRPGRRRHRHGTGRRDRRTVHARLVAAAAGVRGRHAGHFRPVDAARLHDPQAPQPGAAARRQRLGRERARAHQPALRWLADPGGRTA